MKNKDQIFLEQAYELICEKKKKKKTKKKSNKNIPRNTLYGGGYTYWGGMLGYGENGSGGDSGGEGQ
jgi:hypothetical protein